MEVRPADGRTRTALVLLGLALVLPMAWSLVGPPVVFDDPFLLLGLLAAAAAALAICAAVVAPVGVGVRTAVIAVALVNGGGGLWLLAQDTPVSSLGLVSLVSALTGPLQVPALAWLGTASATGLGERVRRSWRASLLLALVVAGLQVLLSVVAVGTYGAALRFTGGFETYLLSGNALAAAATVVTLHVVVSAVRTWRALDGAQLVPALRPWLLAAALGAAVALSVVTTLFSDVL